jgi:hypothetical protein
MGKVVRTYFRSLLQTYILIFFAENNAYTFTNRSYQYFDGDENFLLYGTD